MASARVCVICGGSSVIWGGLLVICGDSGVIWGSLLVIWGDLEVICGDSGVLQIPNMFASGPRLVQGLSQEAPMMTPGRPQSQDGPRMAQV